MRRALYVAALAAATLVAWVATHQLPMPARGLVAFLFVPLPAFMHWQARASAAAGAALPRTGLYLSSALLLWSLVALTAGCAMASHIGARTLGLVALSPAPLAGWTVLTIFAGLSVLVLGRLSGIPESPLLRHLIPVTALEKFSFSALSLSAGFTEELIFRGFLLWALTIASGSLLVAVVLSSVLFGILHEYQDVAGAARATVLGAVLAAPVVATGSLVPAMVAHAAIDLCSGLLLARWLIPPERHD